MATKSYRHLFTIVDGIVDARIDELAARGATLSCRRGCGHCCELLVEVSWEEAIEMAKWLLAQPLSVQQDLERRLKRSASDVRRLFARRRRTQKFMRPVADGSSIPDYLFDEYFAEKARPCPFLGDDKSCRAYAVRPCPCRLHGVTSHPQLCMRTVEDDSKYRVPRELERAKRDAVPAMEAMNRDGRWGQLSIMVEAALAELRRRPRQVEWRRAAPTIPVSA